MKQKHPRDSSSATQKGGEVNGDEHLPLNCRIEDNKLNNDLSPTSMQQRKPPELLDSKGSTAPPPPQPGSPSRSGSLVKCWPLLFERSGPYWWHPQFDSPILEKQYWKSTQPRTTRRFQFGLLYLFVLSLLLAIYFPSMKTQHWPTVLGLSLALCCLLLFVLFLTTTHLYRRNCFKVSLLLAFLLCSLSLLATANVSSGRNDISPAGLYAIYLAVTLLLYTAVPLPLYGTLLVGVTYSALFEALLCLALPDRRGSEATIAVNVLLHLCIHVIGIHTLITTQVRMRDTFMKVGQSLMVKKQLGSEKVLKEKMIHSVMPPKVADWLMKEGHNTEDVDEEDLNDNNVESGSMVRKISSPRSSNQGDIRTIFRPFNMNAMDNVSILFADIVGFTKMSSNKTASQLVGLLNDLFGRFDYLCNKCGCEKISTLGDCYYCVSGCPEPKPDHARNCVEMGLSMISAIKDFDEDRQESVNMRVGIHTGTVLCGIVGKRRFKFDVWSNDVSLANKMESTGMPGMVHISEKTRAFLGDDYFMQEGPIVKDLRTYFITGRANTSFVPLDTRLARRTSSTPATFLLPPIAKSDVTGNIVTQSLPSLPASAAAATAGGNKGNSNTNGRRRQLEWNAVTAKSVIRKLSWRNGRRNIIARSESQRSAATTAAEGASTTVTISSPAGVHVGLTSTASNSSNKSVTKTTSNPMNLSATSAAAGSNCRHCQSEPPTTVADSEAEEEEDEDKKERTQESCAFPGNCCRYKDLHGRRFSNSDPSLLSSSFLAGDGRNNSNNRDLQQPQQPSSNNTLLSDPPSLTCAAIGAAKSSLVPSNPQELAQQRLSADKAMIACVKEDAGHHAYFSKPPLKPFTLCFKDRQVEDDYRRTAWRPNRFSRSFDPPPPYSLSYSLNAYFDLLVSALILLVTSAACFLHYSNPIHSAFFVAAATYHLILTAVCFHQLRFNIRKRAPISRLYVWGRGWYPSHIMGILLIALPVLGIFTNFSCDFETNGGERDLYLQLVFFGVIHFCNLTALNNWVKSVAATAASAVLVLLISPVVCPCGPTAMAAKNNVTLIANDDDAVVSCDHRHTQFMETVLCLSLLVALTWMLNREFEVSYRLSFHCSLLSARDRKKIQSLKNQADWLLHNIIPKHVSDQLKKTRQEYSENHRDVGIVFASLVNFNELYDESYMGGKEYLRVLNELISDFDEVLDRPEFKNVEKIKTIGSTFMAAAGINPYIRQENTHEFQHLRELMEFVMELQNSVSDFNQSLIEFDLILRIGFNYGDVTAGVIGTTKLYYDIWGDAVNIASRMETTGVEGRVQVTEKAAKVLMEWYDFEQRGPIYIKGKDNMNTFLLVGNKNRQKKK